ncbi:MAG: hypothetical protein MK515_01350 [SAR324 cluster bacterium]|nr:hypothetical protein [SAR324 cluster bacterium]
MEDSAQTESMALCSFSRTFFTNFTKSVRPVACTIISGSMTPITVSPFSGC